MQPTTSRGSLATSGFRKASRGQKVALLRALAAILTVASSRWPIGIDRVTRRLRRNAATPVVAVEMEVR